MREFDSPEEKPEAATIVMQHRLTEQQSDDAKMYTAKEQIKVDYIPQYLQSAAWT